MNIATLFQGLASLSWFAFIAVLGILVMRSSRKQPVKGITSLSIGVLVLLSSSQSSAQGSSLLSQMSAASSSRPMVLEHQKVISKNRSSD